MFCEWKSVNKGTTQGSVSGPYLFNILINDLEINNKLNAQLTKYADDATFQVKIYKNDPDFSETVVNQYVTWAEDNRMPCNVFKCKELVLRKKNSLNTHFVIICGLQT